MPQLFAMDTYFYTSLGAYSWRSRCEMLRELGYDATYLTLWSEDAWDDLAQIGDTKARYGLEVAGVYWTLDLDDRGGGGGRFLDALQSVPERTRFEIAVVGEGAFDAGDARLNKWLRAALDIAARRDLHFALYPHIGFWLDRIEKAVAVAQPFDHAHLGVVFCGYHWFALDGKNLSQHLKEAAPLLRSVNLCGSTLKSDGANRQCTIEPLDSGTSDNFAIVGLLQSVGYQGPIGFQGYGMGGDVYANLRHSLSAYRDMEKRLQAHPDWAKMRV